MYDYTVNSMDLTDGRSFVNKIAEMYYPNGQKVIKNTSMSQLPYEDRVLRSADPAKLIQGDGIFRDPAFALTAYAQTTQSALDGIISSQSDLGSLKTVTTADGRTISGSAARVEIMKKSLLSTGYSPSGFQSGLRLMHEGGINNTMIDGGSNDSVLMENDSGQTHSHAVVGYTPMPGANVFNGGTREIAIDDQLTDQEKEAYENKIKELNGKVNFNGSIAQSISLNTYKNSYKDSQGATQSQILSELDFELLQAGTYLNGKYERKALPKDILGNNNLKIRPSAALIEMLLQLTNKMFIEGGLGVRSILGPNFSQISPGDSITDHAFGRAIDIFAIGSSRSDMVSLRTKKKEDYRRAFELFLTNLSSISQSLHPDLIIVHSGLAQEYGIVEGLESGNSVIRQKFPGVASFVNFSADTSHDNHMHVGFSAQRSGTFLTRETVDAYYSNDRVTSFGQGSGSAFAGVSSLPLTLLEKFKTSYIKDQATSFSYDEICLLLSTSGIFTLEDSAIFAGIAEREAGNRPGALNEDRSSRDFSFGILQCNLLPDAHGNKIFPLFYPTQDRVLGLKLAYKFDDVKTQADLSKAVLYKANRTSADERIFIPFNQAIMLGVTATSTEIVERAIKSKKTLGGYIYGPWGDYQITDDITKQRRPRSLVGAIYKVKFSVVTKAYESAGGSVENLKNHIRTRWKKALPYPYIEQWMSGTIFNDDGSVRN